MDAIDALVTRNSVSQLTEPGPSGEQLDNILKAAVRANDHRRLHPWKFLIIEGQAREKLGQLMLSINLEDNPDLSEQKQQLLVAKALRAPMIITVVANVQDNDKVPGAEQVWSAAGAAQLMMVAAHAQGVGAVWRTGNIAHDSRMRKGMGLEETDQIIGFLYMGTPKAMKPLAEVDVNDFVEYWNN